MQKNEFVTGYWPKQDCETTICVTYALAETMKNSYKEPMSFKCKYNSMNGTCSDCPIFDSLT